MNEDELRYKLDNKICLKCGNPISGESQLFCNDCYEESLKRIKNGDSSDNWTLDSLILFLGIFGWDGKHLFRNKETEDDTCSN